MLADAHARGATVGVRGGGTKLGWPAPGRPVDVVVDTRGLDRIVEHAAGDLVVTAQAGVPLQGLQEHVAASRQWLALDPPEDEATIGGVVAAAASGPRRLLYGTPRDLLIGVTVVLADGTVAHSGGKVVKNVAGYDLGKLFTGSFATLGVIAQCTFRLHPVQPARRVVTAVVDDPARAVSAVTSSGAVPAAIEWDGSMLSVVVASVEPAAVAQATDVRRAIGGEVSDELPTGFGARPWTGEPMKPDDIGVKVTHRLGGLNGTLAAVGRCLPSPRLSAHAGSGVIWAAYGGDGSEVESLRRSVSAYDGQVVVVHAPREVKASLDVWGPVRGLEVMRRIKSRFDPDGRMAPGSFVGGI